MWFGLVLCLFVCLFGVYVVSSFWFYCTIAYVWNVHRMSIKIKHRNLEIRKTRNDFSVQVRNFLLSFSLKVFRHKEREAQSFYSGFFICLPPQHMWHPPQRPPRASESQPSSLEAGLNSTNWLFQNLPQPSARFRCVTSFALASLRFPTGQLWHLWVTRPFCVYAWTPVLMLHLSNPCTEPKDSQPN